MSPLVPSSGVRSAICRIAESHKVPFKFEDVTATKFKGPRPENGKGKKRAAGVPAASVATAVDLGIEEGGAPPPAKCHNSSLLEEAVYVSCPVDVGTPPVCMGRGFMLRY
jgi:hypothetical protein